MSLRRPIEPRECRSRLGQVHEVGITRSQATTTTGIRRRRGRMGVSYRGDTFHCPFSSLSFTVVVSIDSFVPCSSVTSAVSPLTSTRVTSDDGLKNLQSRNVEIGRCGSVGVSSVHQRSKRRHPIMTGELLITPLLPGKLLKL